MHHGPAMIRGKSRAEMVVVPLHYTTDNIYNFVWLI